MSRKPPDKRTCSPATHARTLCAARAASIPTLKISPPRVLKRPAVRVSTNGPSVRLNRVASWSMDSNGTFKSLCGIEVGPRGMSAMPGAAAPTARDLIRLFPIGKGRNRSVVAALHVPSFRLVAVKSTELRCKRSRHEMLSELRALSAVRHPNVLQMHGAFVADGGVSLALEYMDGGSLAQAVETRGALPERAIAALVAQTVAGLAYIHSEGYVHGDIKPDNILLATDGSVKLSDFGFARSTGTPGAEVKSHGGALLFLSPEQHRRRVRSTASDIWSLGVTVYLLATGRLPYQSSDYWDVVDAVTNRTPPSLRGCGRKLGSDIVNFVDLCLRANPVHRATAAELLKHPFLAAIGDGRREVRALVEATSARTRRDGAEENAFAERLVEKMLHGLRQREPVAPTTRFHTPQIDEDALPSPTSSEPSVHSTTESPSSMNGSVRRLTEFAVSLTDSFFSFVDSVKKVVMLSEPRARPKVAKVRSAADVTPAHVWDLFEQANVTLSDKNRALLEQKLPALFAEAVAKGKLQDKKGGRASIAGKPPAAPSKWTSFLRALFRIPSVFCGNERVRTVAKPPQLLRKDPTE